MSGRLDSNQRPPEPHSRGQGRFQPPNVTNAGILKTYEFHSSHSLRGLQRKTDDLSTFSGFFPCPSLPEQDCRISEFLPTFARVSPPKSATLQRRHAPRQAR